MVIFITPESKKTCESNIEEVLYVLVFFWRETEGGRVGRFVEAVHTLQFRRNFDVFVKCFNC